MKRDSVEITRPDDGHVHFRSGAVLKAVLPFTARLYARAVVMPNLPKPIVSTAQARAYRGAIYDALPQGSSFTPLMTCFLTEGSRVDDILSGYDEGVVSAVKLYPAHATTHSAHGVTSLEAFTPLFHEMSRVGMPLLVHGEAPHADIFDRERVFIDTTLQPLVDRFPTLKVVFEHITTREAVAFVTSAREGVAATVTPHHLVINRTHLFEGGLRPHLYCLPVAKREEDRLALRRAVTSGHDRFFAGTDSAPHKRTDKESACGCAGIFNAPASLSLYAQVFDEEDSLEALEGFMSLHRARFYGHPLSKGRLRLYRQAYTVPSEVDGIVPFCAGEHLPWSAVCVGN